jgi:hypothetical protein
MVSEDPPRIDRRPDAVRPRRLSSVIERQVKLNPKETQRIEFHADATQRTLSFSGPLAAPTSPWT